MPNSQQIISHFQLTPESFELQKALVGLTDDDCRLLEQIHPTLLSEEDRLVDQFYEHILQFDQARQLLGDSATLRRVKTTQKSYFRRLTSGVYDLDYAQDRVRVGITHERVGLSLSLYIGSFGAYLNIVSGIIGECLSENQSTLCATLTALEKVALLDITLATTAYMQAAYREIENARNDAENRFSNQTRLLSTLNSIQRAFITGHGRLVAMEALLEELLNITASEFGYIGEVRYDKTTDKPFLKLIALTDIAWNTETQALYQQHKRHGMEFHNLENLLGVPLASGRPFISNDPAHEPGSGGLPQGHPELKSYLALPYLDDQGKVIGVIGLANRPSGYNEEITAFLQPLLDTLKSLSIARQTRHQLSRERKSNEDRYLKLLHQSLDAMALMDHDSKFLECNQAAANLFEFSSREAMLKSSPFELSAEVQPGKTHASKLGAALIERGWQQGYQRFEWVHKTHTGRLRPMEVTLSPTVFKGKAVMQVVWRDLTEIKLQEEKIRTLAYFDDLTGLANRNLFQQQLEQMISLAKRADSQVALIYMDLYGLREIKTNLGPALGDRALRFVAHRLKAYIRDSDLLTQIKVDSDGPESLARMSGDEFALAAMVHNADGAQQLAQRISESLSEPFVIDAIEMSIKCRFGLATTATDGNNYDQLLRRADIALQQAKQTTREFCFYNRELGNRVNRRAHLTRRLEHAVKNKFGLALRFQPKVHLKTGSLVGAEVLIRWHDEELGWVSPIDFIPIAEERGIISEITKWVVMQTGRLCRHWLDSGCLAQLDQPLSLAINISTRDLEETGLQTQLAQMLARFDLSPVFFGLELTETAIMNDPQRAIASLEELRRCGFSLAIDDFGTGHSSLSYLRDISADLLKIDMSFIGNMIADPANRAIVETVIATANIFGMQTLAEGIEDEATYQALVDLGCDYGQGYYFDKPLTADEFESKWLMNLSD